MGAASAPAAMAQPAAMAYTPAAGTASFAAAVGSMIVNHSLGQALPTQSAGAEPPRSGGGRTGAAQGRGATPLNAVDPVQERPPGTSLFDPERGALAQDAGGPGTGAEGASNSGDSATRDQGTLGADVVGAAMPVPGLGLARFGVWLKRVLGIGKAARGAGQLIAPGGKKLAQQIARFREAGGTGGPAEFLQHVNGLAQRARAAGNVVTGTVGSGPQAIANGTIFREGSTYVVTDAAGVVRSFVPNAGPGGVASEFIRLGGVP